MSEAESATPKRMDERSDVENSKWPSDKVDRMLSVRAGPKRELAKPKRRWLWRSRVESVCK